MRLPLTPLDPHRRPKIHFYFLVRETYNERVSLRSVFPIAALLLLRGPVPLVGADLPGIDPLPAPEAVMSREALEAFLTQQKKGTPLEIVLLKGKMIRGLFGSYDDYYETVWIVPRGERGVFTEKSYRLSGIKHAGAWDRKKEEAPSASPLLQEVGSSDYELLKAGNGVQ